MAGEQLRATLRGGDATLGSVRARDVARLITGLEAAVAAGAYATLGKPRRGATGRHKAAVEAASRLRFETVEAGSVVAVLGLPELTATADSTLDMNVDDLAGAAFDRIVATFGQPDELVDRGVARALSDLAKDLGIGERHDELVLASERSDSFGRLDPAASDRLRRLADAPLGHQPDVLVGTLREADFDRRSARLHTAAGETVVVGFPAELEGDIHDALRARASFEGEVIFDAATATVRRVEVRRISTPEPLPFDPAAFWHPVSVEELARIQGIAPATLDGPLAELSVDEVAEIESALADLEA
jgi:hypothetical protein